MVKGFFIHTGHLVKGFMMKRALSIVLAIILLSSSVFSLPASSYVEEQTMVYVLNSNQNPSKDNFA